MYFEYEIVIRDDGTNDGTHEYLLSLYGNNDKIKLLDSATNVGAAKNLITLLNSTSGEYVAHLDGDDVLCDADHYQRSVDFLDANQEYAMTSGGYKYIKGGEITPVEHWLCGGKQVVELKDLLVENYISLGRVFKKFNVPERLFDGAIYPDWIMNFEILKAGKGYCFVNNLVGYYRIHSGGMFTMGTDEEKNRKKEIEKLELTKRYTLFKNKVITIVDSYVRNDSVKNKLSNMLDWLNTDGHEILLVSNTVIDPELIKKTKFYLYDSRNQLFKEKYENVPSVDLWRGYDTFAIHDIVFDFQRHGLSVLINLFNSLLYAKSQGYVYFQRFEVDDLYGVHSRDFISKVPEKCHVENKKGLFYYNKQNNPPDVSFHYYYCEIDHFLNKVKKITCEADYVEYLRNFYGNKDFKIVETFIYDNLTANGDCEILSRSGNQMQTEDFTDTQWNTETSASGFDKKYRGCATKIYQIKPLHGAINALGYVVFTYSYKDSHTQRRIEVETDDGNITNLVHATYSMGGWVWNMLPDKCKSIIVYDGDVLLYKEYVSECISYINFN